MNTSGTVPLVGAVTDWSAAYNDGVAGVAGSPVNRARLKFAPLEASTMLPAGSSAKVPLKLASSFFAAPTVVASPAVPNVPSSVPSARYRARAKYVPDWPLTVTVPPTTILPLASTATPRALACSPEKLVVSVPAVANVASRVPSGL